MKAQTKKNLLQMGGTALGAVIGGPIGASIGGGVGTLAGGLVPDDELVTKTKTVYPELSHAANYTTSPLPKPQQFTYYPDVESSKFDNLMSVATPLISGMASSLMGSNFKGILPMGQPKANSGMHTGNAPSHEEGGIDVEVEGGELILNKEQQAYIDAGVTAEEKAARYQEVRSHLIRKGMNEPAIADKGLYAGNENQNQKLWEQNNKYPEVLGPYGTIPALDIGTNMTTRLMANTSFSDNIEHHRDLMKRTYRPNPGNGLNTMSLYGGPGITQTTEQIVGGNEDVIEEDTSLSFFDDAIKAQKNTNKLGMGSDISKMLISAGGLINPMPTSKPFTANRIVAPEYKDQGEQMMGDLNQFIATNNAVLKDLSPEQRVAGLSNIMQEYQKGLRDVSKHKTEISNLNAGARADATNQNTMKKVELDQMNYQKTMLENQAEHMRKQVALNEIMKSIDGMIMRSGQSKTNMAGLEMIKSMWPTLDDKYKAELASIFNLNV
jgi:hypothetical protein